MEIDASIVLDELVHQFADPMAFFRELIQNSIDAGTGEIEITVDWTPYDDASDRGRMTVEVRDFGVGMDRQVIRNELLKLFNSGKDRDLTKIGRFGIGFVSVFAVEPDAVCVDTGRAGESWRVLFDADRSFELFDRGVPFEGTSVRLFKDISQADFIVFKNRARAVIHDWCKHVELPMHFNGEPIGAAFDVISACKVTMETEGTRIVAGYTTEQSPQYGYYHSGLTLMEGSGGPWPHVTFKLDSRYLEHTLTRDQIIEDKNFHKALELLENVVRERLPDRLFHSLEQAAADGDLARVETLAQLAMKRPTSRQVRGMADLDRRTRKTRALFPVFGGEPVTATRLGSAEFVLWNAHASPVVDHLPPTALVLKSPDGKLATFASFVLERSIPNADRTLCFIDSEPPSTEPEQALADAVVAMLDRKPRTTSLTYGTVETSVQTANRPWVAVDQTGRPHPIEALAPMSLETLYQAKTIVLNQRNPLIERLLETAVARPEWSAFMLLVLTCPDATADDPGADEYLRRAYRLEMEDA